MLLYKREDSNCSFFQVGGVLTPSLISFFVLTLQCFGMRIREFWSQRRIVKGQKYESEGEQNDIKINSVFEGIYLKQMFLLVYFRTVEWNKALGLGKIVI